MGRGRVSLKESAGVAAALLSATASSKRLILHNLDRSRSYRVIWLLEELSVEYTIKQYSREGGSNPVSEGAKIHPLSCSNIIASLKTNFLQN